MSSDVFRFSSSLSSRHYLLDRQRAEPYLFIDSLLDSSTCPDHFRTRNIDFYSINALSTSYFLCRQHRTRLKRFDIVNQIDENETNVECERGRACNRNKTNNWKVSQLIIFYRKYTSLGKRNTIKTILLLSMNMRRTAFHLLVLCSFL
jgi:hypothetical protein